MSLVVGLGTAGPADLSLPIGAQRDFAGCARREGTPLLARGASGASGHAGGASGARETTVLIEALEGARRIRPTSAGTVPALTVAAFVIAVAEYVTRPTVTGERAAAALLAGAVAVRADALALAAVTVDVTGWALAAELAAGTLAAQALTVGAVPDANSVVSLTGDMTRWLLALEFAVSTYRAGAGASLTEVTVAAGKGEGAAGSEPRCEGCADHRARGAKHDWGRV